jgi:pyruvate dehydrogenase E2 component (dihydrolipoamide acetyltransferase)
MAETVLLPRQGNTVESCIILEWKKEEGDDVSEGEVICEVETDKATFEVESSASGVLRKQLVSEGDDVPVLSPIAVVGGADENISALLDEAKGGEAPAGGSEEAPSPESGAEREEAPAPESEAGAGSAAAEAEVGAGSAASAGDTSGAPTAAAAAGESSAGPRARGSEASSAEGAVSPRARMRARELAVDPSSLTGSGPEGRVIERDILEAAERRGPVTSAAKQVLSAAGGRMSAAEAAAVGSPAPGAAESPATQSAATGGEYPGGYEETPVRSVRKVIAQRMHASLQETAQLTLHRRADARALLSYRKRLKESEDEALQGVSMNDLIMFAVSRALTEFPGMNSHFLGDTIRTFREVHLGFAVDTDRGLMVPTVTSAHRRSLKGISNEAKRLAALCLEGKAGPEELREGTFTVTNLGALGVDYFTPVLNPPQVGILGVGGILPYPASIQEPESFIPQIALSLTIDHQGVDGAPGARFLDRVAKMLSQIDLVLAG